MSIQHKDITGSNVHEPKGIDTAIAGTSYIANGAGSGTWSKLGTNGLKGMPSGSPASDLIITTDGSGGLKTGAPAIYGVATVTNSPNQNIFSAWVPPSGAVVLTQASGATLKDQGVRVSSSGVYRIVSRSYANISKGSIYDGTAFNQLRVRFRKNGSDLGIVQEDWIIFSPTAPTKSFVEVVEYFTLAANDYIEVVFSSENLNNNPHSLTNLRSILDVSITR